MEGMRGTEGKEREFQALGSKADGLCSLSMRQRIVPKPGPVVYSAIFDFTGFFDLNTVTMSPFT